MKAIALALIALSLPAQAASLRLDGADYVGVIQGAGQSCASQLTVGRGKAADLEGAKALVGTLALSWAGPGKLTLSSMVFTFPGKQFFGGQSVEVSGAELGFLWQGWDEPVVFAARESRSSTPFCFFQVGGLKVMDPYEYFEGVGTIRVSGTYLEGGVQRGISYDLPFRFHYNPEPRK